MAENVFLKHLVLHSCRVRTLMSHPELQSQGWEINTELLFWKTVELQGDAGSS